MVVAAYIVRNVRNPFRNRRGELLIRRSMVRDGRRKLYLRIMLLKKNNNFNGLGTIQLDGCLRTIVWL